MKISVKKNWSLLENGYLCVFNMVIMKIETYITQAFSSVRYKSKRRGEAYPTFTKSELRVWLYQNGIQEKWIEYIESGYDKNKKPSIDRKDDYGIYEFSNMQLITWRENHIKGVNGNKHKENSKNQNLTKPVFIWDKKGELKKECNNYREASEYLGCHLVSISRATTGRRKTIKGYVLTNSNTLTNTELTINL